MGSKLPPPDRSARSALKYFHRYNYPLTTQEIYFWQPQTSLPLSQIARLCVSDPHIFRHGDYSSLSASPRLSRLRRQSRVLSTPKWEIARQVSKKLSQIPTILGVFVTGSLAMDNCQPSDDIDIMLITASDSLWITRFLVALYLKMTGLRRPPHLLEHSSPQIADKICDNLYLDLNNLQIKQSLYLAHETLQAICLFDRGGIHRRFLEANSWVKSYLPVAYRQTLKKTSQLSISLSSNLIIKFINYIFYVIQYLYMQPRLTSEKIGLGFAFFHPRSVK